MKVAFYDTHTFEKEVFTKKNESYNFDIEYLPYRLNKDTAKLSKGFDVICAFVNDKLDAETLKEIKKQGVGFIALRSAGFNHVDLAVAKELGISVARVPAYSPNAIAEYTIGMLLCLNRKIHKAYNRVRELNFSLDGLVGFDLNQKTIGIIGTGKIGSITAEILHAFGCRLLCFDLEENEELKKLKNLSYVGFDEICKQSDVISLHVPLTPKTHHLLDDTAFSKMKDGVYIINTGRGALIDSKALIKSLKKQKIGGAALDVYEEEEAVFFQDVSNQVLQDDILARLLTFPNVIISSHQAFLTNEALSGIAETTLQNIDNFYKKKPYHQVL